MYTFSVVFNCVTLLCLTDEITVNKNRIARRSELEVPPFDTVRQNSQSDYAKGIKSSTVLSNLEVVTSYSDESLPGFHSYSTSRQRENVKYLHKPLEWKTDHSKSSIVSKSQNQEDMSNQDKNIFMKREKLGSKSSDGEFGGYKSSNKLSEFSPSKKLSNILATVNGMTAQKHMCNKTRNGKLDNYYWKLLSNISHNDYQHKPETSDHRRYHYSDNPHLQLRHRLNIPHEMGEKMKSQNTYSSEEINLPQGRGDFLFQTLKEIITTEPSLRLTRAQKLRNPKLFDTSIKCTALGHKNHKNNKRPRKKTRENRKQSHWRNFLNIPVNFALSRDDTQPIGVFHTTSRYSYKINTMDGLVSEKPEYDTNTTQETPDRSESTEITSIPSIDSSETTKHIFLMKTIKYVIDKRPSFNTYEEPFALKNPEYVTSSLIQETSTSQPNVPSTINIPPPTIPSSTPTSHGRSTIELVEARMPPSKLPNQYKMMKSSTRKLHKSGTHIFKAHINTIPTPINLNIIIGYNQGMSRLYGTTEPVYESPKATNQITRKDAIPRGTKREYVKYSVHTTEMDIGKQDIDKEISSANDLGNETSVIRSKTSQVTRFKNIYTELISKAPSVDSSGTSSSENIVFVTDELSPPGDDVQPLVMADTESSHVTKAMTHEILSLQSTTSFPTDITPSNISNLNDLFHSTEANIVSEEVTKHFNNVSSVTPNQITVDKSEKYSRSGGITSMKVYNLTELDEIHANKEESTLTKYDEGPHASTSRSTVEGGQDSQGLSPYYSYLQRIPHNVDKNYNSYNYIAPVTCKGDPTCRHHSMLKGSKTNYKKWPRKISTSTTTTTVATTKIKIIHHNNKGNVKMIRKKTLSDEDIMHNCRFP